MAMGLELTHSAALPAPPVCEVGKQANRVAKEKIMSPKGQNL